jgi:hypothetical protein
VSAHPSTRELAYESFASLYASAHLDLFRFVLTLCRIGHVAEDVVQETARLLWRKFCEYDPGAAFPAVGAAVRALRSLESAPALGEGGSAFPG